MDLNQLEKALEKNGIRTLEAADGSLLIATPGKRNSWKWDGTGEHWPLFGAIMGILESNRIMITVRPLFAELVDEGTGYQAVHSPVGVECLPSVNVGPSYTAAAALALIEAMGGEG